MKRTKQYQKGKHLIIKSGNKKEIHTLKPGKAPEVVFEDNYFEDYIDHFMFEKHENGMKVIFGKKIFGTERIHIKRVITMSKKTAKEMIKILKGVLENYKV